MNMTESARFNLNLPHIDDEMEMATSPYRQADDIDIDLDPVHESADKSLIDEPEHTIDELDSMQADTEITYQDDDMIDDEEFDDQTYNSANQDLNMEAYNENNAEDRDEDIMFDEPEATAIHYESKDYHESSNTDTPLGQAQQENQDQEQEQINPIETPQEAKVHQAHGDYPQQTTSESQANDKFKDTDQEPTTLSEDLDAEHRLDDDQTKSEAEQVSETYIRNTEINEESDNSVRGDVAKSQEQASNTDDANAPESTIQEEAKDAQQSPSVQLQEGSSTKDSNAPQFVETEEQGNSTLPTDEVSSDFHPVVITYLGQEMSLFPPSFGDTSATFFLADPSLAYDPFEKLLVACRSLLGESLEHDDELVLDIPTLGLHICEDSKYSSELGLAQVLDIYLSLSRNERTDPPEPLYCHLSSRVCLSSQYAYLVTSAREGKCYSEIAADYAESPEEDVETYDDGSEHQQNRDEDHNTMEGIDHLEQNDAIDNLRSTEMQEKPVSIESPVADLVEAAGVAADMNPPPTEEIPGDAGDIEQTQSGDVESDSLSAKELANDNAEVTEAAVSNEQDLQPASEEQEDLDGDGKEAEQGVPAMQDFVNKLPEEIPTPSSHTVEADYAASQRDLEEDQVSPDRTQVDDDHEIVPQADDEYAEDAIDYSDEDPVNDDVPEATEEFLDKEDNPDLDEDLFAPQSNDQTVKDDTTNASEVTNGDDVNSTWIDKADQSILTAESSHNLAEEDDDFLDFGEEVDSVPVTPSKPSGNKRKALDEDDELRFLDMDTPEPKRRRPS